MVCIIIRSRRRSDELPMGLRGVVVWAYLAGLGHCRRSLVVPSFRLSARPAFPVNQHYCQCYLYPSCTSIDCSSSHFPPTSVHQVDSLRNTLMPSLRIVYNSCYLRKTVFCLLLPSSYSESHKTVSMIWDVIFACSVEGTDLSARLRPHRVDLPSPTISSLRSPAILGLLVTD